MNPWKLLLFVFGPAALVSVALLVNAKENDALNEKELRKVVASTLESIQGESIRKNVEYCGYIVKLPERAELLPVGPVEGTRLSCTTPTIYKPYLIVASFHSHGGMDHLASTEFPSSVDFDAVEKEKVDAFVSTPGGRIWRISAKSKEAMLLCGPHSCLPRDPRVLAISLPSILNKRDVIKLESGLQFLR